MVFQETLDFQVLLHSVGFLLSVVLQEPVDFQLSLVFLVLLAQVVEVDSQALVLFQV